MDEKDKPVKKHSDFWKIPLAERKEILKKTYIECLGSLLHTAKKLGVDRSMIFDWLRDNNGLRAELEEIKNHEIRELLEFELYKKAIEDKDKSALMWILERKYGYTSKKEIEQTNKNLIFKLTMNEPPPKQIISEESSFELLDDE